MKEVTNETNQPYPTTNLALLHFPAEPLLMRRTPAWWSNLTLLPPSVRFQSTCPVHSPRMAQYAPIIAFKYYPFSKNTPAKSAKTQAGGQHKYFDGRGSIYSIGFSLLISIPRRQVPTDTSSSHVTIIPRYRPDQLHISWPLHSMTN